MVRSEFEMRGESGGLSGGSLILIYATCEHYVVEETVQTATQLRMYAYFTIGSASVMLLPARLDRDAQAS